MPTVARKPKTKPGKSTVQSLLFPKKKFTKSQAKAWAKKHGYHAGTVDSGSGEYLSIRQYNPSDFSRIRTKTLPGGSGVKARIGVVKKK
jgi:hypothetical protein